MKIKQILAVCIFLAMVLSLSFGQKLDLSLPFTKEQMYKDFDEFVQIIKDINIQGDVREVVTGYNPLTYIQRERPKIENLNSYHEFIGFLEKCLSYTMCAHASAAEKPIGIGLWNLDTSAIAVFASEWQEYEKQKAGGAQTIGRTFYYNGDYYIYGTQKMIKRYSEKNDTIVISDMRLISSNGQPMDTLFWKTLSSTYPIRLRWDYRKKKYYTGWLSIAPPQRILVEDFPTKKQYVLPLDSFNIEFSGISLPDSITRKITREKSDNKTVKYYDSLGLLYIYMGAMIEDSVFIDSIKKVGKNKPIKKIIFDVRDNVGGSDYAWQYVLQAIIKDTLEEKIVVAMKNTEFAWKYIDVVKQEKKIQETRLPFLKNIDVVVLPSEIYKFPPDSNSLAFGGNIYILQNEKVFSSGQALVTYSKQIPQLISVGVPTGHLAGRGYGKWIFQLKESKFTFYLDATIDVLGVKTADELFHDRPEIEIYPTLQEIIDMNNYGRFLNKRGDEFLFKHDYLFKKVLEMK